MLNIGSYIVETVAFAHVLPINRDYTILVFVGRKKKATCNRFVFALTRFENGELTIVDEISIPSCEMTSMATGCGNPCSSIVEKVT